MSLIRVRKVYARLRADRGIRSKAGAFRAIDDLRIVVYTKCSHPVEIVGRG